MTNEQLMIRHHLINMELPIISRDAFSCEGLTAAEAMADLTNMYYGSRLNDSVYLHPKSLTICKMCRAEKGDDPTFQESQSRIKMLMTDHFVQSNASIYEITNIHSFRRPRRTNPIART